MNTNIGRFCLLAVIVCVSFTQKCFSADATGLKPGIYTVGADGKFHAITNIDIPALWPGTWKDGTNGLRVELRIEKEGGQATVKVGVGSVVFNSLGGYVGTPNGKFALFELRDTNGVAIPYVKGMSLEGHFPPRISVKDIPRSPFGELNNHIAFFTNGGPFTLANVNIAKLYQIPKENDYALTVCPVIYKFGTNVNYLERVILPSVTLKIHLIPAQKQ